MIRSGEIVRLPQMLTMVPMPTTGMSGYVWVNPVTFRPVPSTSVLRRPVNVRAATARPRVVPRGRQVTASPSILRSPTTGLGDAAGAARIAALHARGLKLPKLFENIAIHGHKSGTTVFDKITGALSPVLKVAGIAAIAGAGIAAAPRIAGSVAAAGRSAAPILRSAGSAVEAASSAAQAIPTAADLMSIPVPQPTGGSYMPAQASAADQATSSAPAMPDWVIPAGIAALVLAFMSSRR